MSDSIDRRRFLGVAATTGLGLELTSRAARAARLGANERIVVGVMGMGGRGTQLAKNFQGQPELDVAYVCDVDQTRANQAARSVSSVEGSRPRPVRDFRRILDDKSVDALVVATSDHWHAPASILACAAGMHVYVEKPCSHNAREGEWMVHAARKHNRVVQLGTQRRSLPKISEAIERIHSGLIGRVYFARAWYADTRGSIGRGQTTAVPDRLDYQLWQGPAPRRPYRDNIIHYNWHWFWHWGTSELGNNGVHTIDLCRWGLGVDYPIQVSSGGGRYRFDDDQETPDTHVVTFDFEDRKSILWQGLSCNRHGMEGPGSGISFHGEKGTVVLSRDGYTVYDLRDRQIAKTDGSGSDTLHIANFLDGIRGRASLNAEIEEGHKSTLLCHLGNIAYRTGRTLKCDPKDGHILDDPAAMALWGREYEPGWEPKV